MESVFGIKSGDTRPAAIMHAVNNGNPCILKYFLNTEIFAEKYPGPVVTYTLLLIPMLVIDAIIILLVMRENKNSILGAL